MSSTTLGNFLDMISEEQVKKYCSEDISTIENYEQAINDERMWDCHHRAEILPCGNFTRDALKKFGLYYHRPSFELIFLTHSEHRRLHNKGNHHSEETKRKMSELKTGKTSNRLGVKLSEETRRKMSEARKAFWAKRKNADASFNVENGI